MLSIDGGSGALTKIADIREPGLFGSGRKVGELHSGNSFGESVAIFLFWAAVLITLGLPALIIWGIVGSVRPSARGRVLPQLVACLAIGGVIGTLFFLNQTLRPSCASGQQPES